MFASLLEFADPFCGTVWADSIKIEGGQQDRTISRWARYSLLRMFGGTLARSALSKSLLILWDCSVAHNFRRRFKELEAHERSQSRAKQEG